MEWHSPGLEGLQGPKTSPESLHLTLPSQAAHKAHPRPEAVLEGDLADPRPVPVTPAPAGMAGGAEVVIVLISPPHMAPVCKAAPWG